MSVIQRITETGTYYKRADSGEELGPFTTEQEQDANLDIQVAAQLQVEPREILEARLNELKREITFQEVAEVLSSTVRFDTPNKLILFSAGLLTFTEQDQVNVLMSGESAGGKSYSALEIASYFPNDILIILGNASPRAFYHESGTWDKDRKQLIVDLKGKLLVLLDNPHYSWLQQMRPLLSHDREEIIFKITDKNKSGALRTKTVVIRGYPTVVFCGAKMGLDQQEATRLMILSPETSQEKLAESIRLRISRDSNRAAFKEWIDSHLRRKWLKARIQAVRDAAITEIIVPNQERIYERFIQEHGRLAPRNQRDISRIISMVKASALLNWSNRKSPSVGTIEANESDVAAGFELYERIAPANELGLSPELYAIWLSDIQPLIEENPSGVDNKLILTAYHKRTGRFMAPAKLRREILPAIEGAGLITQIQDPLDKRLRLVVRAVTEPLSPDSSHISTQQTKWETSGSIPPPTPTPIPHIQNTNAKSSRTDQTNLGD
jgi:hypothetical protein